MRRRWRWYSGCRRASRWRNSRRMRRRMRSATTAVPTSWRTAQGSRPAASRRCNACNAIRHDCRPRAEARSPRSARRPRRRQPRRQRLRHLPLLRLRHLPPLRLRHLRLAPARPWLLRPVPRRRRGNPQARSARRSARLARPTSYPAARACSRVARRPCNACKVMRLSFPPAAGRPWMPSVAQLLRRWLQHPRHPRPSSLDLRSERSRRCRSGSGSKFSMSAEPIGCSSAVQSPRVAAGSSIASSPISLRSRPVADGPCSGRAADGSSTGSVRGVALRRRRWATARNLPFGRCGGALR